MRHRQSNKKLGRTSAHRIAMFRNMANSLFTHQLIKTTEVKAKELRRIAEPLITIAKKGDTVANRRLVFNRTRSKAVVGILFDELAPRYAQRPGGYTRVLKANQRVGDAAPLAYVELVDRPIENFEVGLSEESKEVLEASEAKSEA